MTTVRRRPPASTLTETLHGVNYTTVVDCGIGRGNRDQDAAESITMAGDHDDTVDHLLGDLEAAIMRLMWERPQATVRDVVALLKDQGRALAYTTVMTVMSRLVEKGVLTRDLAGKTHIYRSALSEDSFKRRAAAQRVQALVDDFGDIAIAHFLLTVNDLAPERLRELERLAHGDVPPK